jgi:hypothetical protein
LKTSAIGAVAITGASGVMADSAKAESTSPRSTIQTKANEISKKLFADDGLAIPITTKPMISSLAKGLDRTKVLGGGEHYIAWYCGFFHGLIEAGLDMAGLCRYTHDGEFKKDLLWAKAEKVTNGIVVVCEKSHFYLPRLWCAIMVIIRAIPIAIFKVIKL